MFVNTNITELEKILVSHHKNEVEFVVLVDFKSHFIIMLHTMIFLRFFSNNIFYFLKKKVTEISLTSIKAN